MRVLVKLSPICLLLALFLLPSHARADSVIVNSGYLSVTGQSRGAVFSFGNPGPARPGDDKRKNANGKLEFAVSNGPRGAEAGSLSSCAPCRPGQLTTISAQFATESGLGSGAVTVGGVSYSRLYYTGALMFDAALITIPLDSSPLVTINIPFTMSGFINGYETSFRNTPHVFSMFLSGQGIATLVLSSHFDPFFGYTYDFRSVTYNFSPNTPTPEPATLLLLGTGLTALAARYRRRKSSTKQ